MRCAILTKNRTISYYIQDYSFKLWRKIGKSVKAGISNSPQARYASRLFTIFRQQKTIMRTCSGDCRFLENGLDFREEQISMNTPNANFLR